jgi:hypothetical protein
MLSACGSSPAQPVAPEAPAPSTTPEPVAAAPDEPMVTETEQPAAPDALVDAAPTDEVRVFVDRLLAVAHTSDAGAWAALLAKKRRARGPEYVKNHFEIWKEAVLKLEPTLKKANLSLEDRGERQRVVFTAEGKKPEALVTVSREDGELRIDEN